MPAAKKKTPAESRIAEIAYDLWDQNGRPEGDDQRFWFDAVELAIVEMKPVRRTTTRKTAAATKAKTTAKKAPAKKTTAKTTAKKPTAKKTTKAAPKLAKAS